MSYTISRGDLDGVVVFLAVAEERGFRAAARRLGITPSAVSQDVRAFEERVGAALFACTTRSVGLTEAGERLLLQVRPAAQQVLQGIESARSLGKSVTGRVVAFVGVHERGLRPGSAACAGSRRRAL